MFKLINSFHKEFIFPLALLCTNSVIAAESRSEMSNEEIESVIESLEQRMIEQQIEIDALKQRLLSRETSEVNGNQNEINTNFISVDSEYNFNILDHAERTNTKQLYQLQYKKNNFQSSNLIIGGQVTALINYQQANENTRFGWLMRHPTSNNQIGTVVSEAVIHSSNINATANFGDSFTGYVELLYNPEQNFSSGSTITGLPRNNVNTRRAYILWGDLNQSPLYASVGKMDIPFGWNDTVSPFTNSSNWHSFAGLAYGALAGYYDENFHLRAMLIQGGAQFRNANTPVDNTNVPSRLNNFAVDANYNFQFSPDENLNIGLSYQYGTAFCQEYENDPSTFVIAGPNRINAQPQGVRHFQSCSDNNDAIAAYAIYDNDDFRLFTEYASTLDVWPGTANPYIPQFDAEKSEAFSIGARDGLDFGFSSNIIFSLEFSRFKAGASGSDWEKQDQLVLGGSYFLQPNLNFFAELIRVDGWVPLNFLSGGNPGSIVGTSWSSQSSNTNILSIGIQAGF